MAVDSIKNRKKTKRVAWGITGSGDRLLEVYDVMKQIKKQHKDNI